MLVGGGERVSLGELASGTSQRVGQRAVATTIEDCLGALPDSFLSSFPASSLPRLSVSVPLTVCLFSGMCFSHSLTAGPMTVFGSLFRAWPSPAVPQIPRGGPSEGV